MLVDEQTRRCRSPSQADASAISKIQIAAASLPEVKYDAASNERA